MNNTFLIYWIAVDKDQSLNNFSWPQMLNKSETDTNNNNWNKSI